MLSCTWYRWSKSHKRSWKDIAPLYECCTEENYGEVYRFFSLSIHWCFRTNTFWYNSRDEEKVYFQIAGTIQKSSLVILSYYSVFTTTGRTQHTVMCWVNFGYRGNNIYFKRKKKLILPWICNWYCNHIGKKNCLKVSELKIIWKLNWCVAKRIVDIIIVRWLERHYTEMVKWIVLVKGCVVKSWLIFHNLWLKFMFVCFEQKTIDLIGLKIKLK